MSISHYYLLSIAYKYILLAIVLFTVLFECSNILYDIINLNVHCRAPKNNSVDEAQCLCWLRSPVHPSKPHLEPLSTTELLSTFFKDGIFPECKYWWNHTVCKLLYWLQAINIHWISPPSFVEMFSSDRNSIHRFYHSLFPLIYWRLSLKIDFWAAMTYSPKNWLKVFGWAGWFSSFEQIPLTFIC